MRNLIIAMFMFLVCAAACGPDPKSAQPQTTQPDKYHVGQYVYIHGEVKGIIKNQNCGCNGGKYKVVVAGQDGSPHTWFVNDDELSATRDTAVLKVIVQDTMTTVIYKNTLDNNQIAQRILTEDEQAQRDIKKAISKLNPYHSEIK
jgi:hypothetical protein